MIVFGCCYVLFCPCFCVCVCVRVFFVPTFVFVSFFRPCIFFRLFVIMFLLWRSSTCPILLFCVLVPYTPCDTWNTWYFCTLVTLVDFVGMDVRNCRRTCDSWARRCLPTPWWTKAPPSCGRRGNASTSGGCCRPAWWPWTTRCANSFPT